MATRLVTGEILKHDGSGWAGATVKFQLLQNTYTVSPPATYPIKPLSRVTDENGQFSVTLAAGLGVKYEVTFPDGRTAEIAVPEGTQTTLEQLRLVSGDTMPEPPEDWQAFVEAVVSESDAVANAVTVFMEGIVAEEIVQDYLAAAIPDSDTIEATYNDTDGVLDLEVKPNTTQQKVAVRKNSTGSGVGTRQRLNFIEGANVTLTIADDATDDEVDVTIAATGGGGGGSLDIHENNDPIVEPATILDFDGTDFNITDMGSGRALVELAGGGLGITVKEDNVTALASATAVDFEGDHFNVTDAGSGRAYITLASPGGGGGGGTGSTTIASAFVFQEGAADSTSLVAAGTKGYIRVPYDLTITGYTILTDVSATVRLDVWKIASGTALPTNSDSITASAKPTLTADDVIHSTTLTGWTVSVTAGDILAWEVEANDNAHLVMFLLEYTHTIVNQYTDEDAQDAVGAMLVDSTSIDFTYTDATPALTAAVIYGGSGGNNGTAATAARSDHVHTGVYAAASHTHATSDVTNFAEAVMDTVDTMIADSATIDKTYTDGSDAMSFAVIPDTVNQRVLVNKNGGTAVGPRREINIIEDTGMTVTVADDVANNRVNVTLASAGGGGGGSLAVKEGNTNVVATASAIDFDASDFNVADAGSARATVALAYGTSAGTPAEGNHTHTASAITDFTDAAQDAAGAAATDTASIDFTYNSGTNQLTADIKFPSSGVGNNGTASTPARSDHNHNAGDLVGALEFVQDAMNTTIVDGIGLTKTYDDGLGTYTLDADIGTGSTQVAAGNHTHVAANISDLTTVVNELARDALGTALTDSSSIDFTPNDAGDTITAAVIYAGSGGAYGTAGTSARSDHSHTVTKSLNFPFGDEDGQGAVVATTARRTISIPVGWGTCTITRWRVLTDQSATVTLDVWKDAYSNYPPTNADSITASAKPGTSAATKNESTSLTGWTTTFTGGDVLKVEVEANNNALFILLVLEFTMTAA